MTLLSDTPTTTAHVLEDVRKRIASRPGPFDAARPLADRAEAKLCERLPDVDPTTIATVLLHAASVVGTQVIVECNADGVQIDRYVLLGLNVLAVLGERMLTEAAEETS